MNLIRQDVINNLRTSHFGLYTLFIMAVHSNISWIDTFLFDRRGVYEAIHCMIILEECG